MKKVLDYILFPGGRNTKGFTKVYSEDTDIGDVESGDNLGNGDEGSSSKEISLRAEKSPLLTLLARMYGYVFMSPRTIPFNRTDWKSREEIEKEAVEEEEAKEISSDLGFWV